MKMKSWIWGALLLSGAAQAATVNLSVTFDLLNGTFSETAYTSEKVTIQPFTLDTGDTVVVDFSFLPGQSLLVDGIGTINEQLRIKFDTFKGTEFFGATSQSLTFSGIEGDYNSDTFNESSSFFGVANYTFDDIVTSSSFSFTGGSTQATVTSISSPESLGDVYFSMFGDVVTVEVVPVPAAVWLFGSGLLGLVGMARRKKA